MRSVRGCGLDPRDVAQLLGLPLLTVLLARQLRRQARLGSPVLAWSVLAVWVLGVAGVLVFLVNFPPVRSIMDYERGGQDSYLPGVGSMLIDHPLIYVYKITSVNLVVTLLVLLGAALTVRRTHARWLVASLLAAVVLQLVTSAVGSMALARSGSLIGSAVYSPTHHNELEERTGDEAGRPGEDVRP